MIRPAPSPALALAATALALGLSACSGTPIPEDRVAALRQQVASTRADPQVNRYASVPAYEAAQTLDRAERAAQAGDARAFDHWAYMTERRLEIARARAAAEAARGQRQAVVLEGARQTEQGTVYTLSEVLFETGKAALAPGASNRLQPLASYLRSNAGNSVVVEGFTDSVGSAEANRQLSQQRAEAVRDYLVTQGIDANRVVARGMGEDFPIASNDTAAGRQQNRRVEVLISEAPE